MRRTKIVCTLGPASEAPATVRELVRAGMDVARLNVSHGSAGEHLARLRAVRAAAGGECRQVAVLLDLQGPEVRLGPLPGGSVHLREGQAFTLFTGSGQGGPDSAPVDYPGLPNQVQPGTPILLDDGNLVLEVSAIAEGAVHCRVRAGGVLTGGKKLNLPGVRLALPAITARDRDCLALAVEHGVEWVAASFVREPADILAVRRLLEELGGDQPIIAKMETAEGVANLEDILKVADGLMVARGDLGVEMPPEDVPVIQKRLIARANRLGKPVITATQMLESMVVRPRPTRAEASDVANAIYDGSDALMLSAETAVGSHPVEAVRTMARIAERVEQDPETGDGAWRRARVPLRTVTDAISHATCQMAADLEASAIITATTSGHTARMVARYRPWVPVLAATPNPAVARRLALVWGVRPVLTPGGGGTDRLVEQAIGAAAAEGLVADGDLVVVTAGVPAGVPGTTNLVKVETVGDILVRGTGIGGRPATGPVRLGRRPNEFRERFQPGDILVAFATDRDFMPLLERAAGVVVEEGGMTSHAAVAGLSLGIPVVVGAEGAMGILREGQKVTIDPARGLVYRGQARVP
ncbi:MAG: pyruvate kinase [bacterium]|nr:pyruvate kinase [bacterium]